MNKEEKNKTILGLSVLGGAVVIGTIFGFALGRATADKGHLMATLAVQKYAETLGGTKEGFRAFYDFPKK